MFFFVILWQINFSLSCFNLVLRATSYDVFFNIRETVLADWRIDFRTDLINY